MTKLLIFIPAENGTPPEVEIELYRSFNGALPVITTHLVPNESQLPEAGYRPLRESAYISEAGQSAPERPTHSRFGPWVAKSAEAYPCDLPIGQRFDEVVICTCAYSPIPDAENPWVPIRRLAPTVESFGGDVAAFEAWQSDRLKSGQESNQAAEAAV